MVYELNGEYLSYNECSHELTLMKKQNSWLREVDSQALIQSLRNLAEVYSSYISFGSSGKLRALDLGSDKTGYYNAELYSFSIGANTMLQESV